MTTLSVTDLAVTDRCDRCGARAEMRLTVGAGDLLFCGHHRREHQDKIHETLAATE